MSMDTVPRQKTSIVSGLLSVWCNAFTWLCEHFWIGSQCELAEKERYDALGVKDTQIAALQELLAKEQQLTAELSEEILSLDNKLVATELQLHDDEIVIGGLRDDLAVMSAKQKSILGGRRRKCR